MRRLSREDERGAYLTVSHKELHRSSKGSNDGLYFLARRKGWLAVTTISSEVESERFL